MVVVYQRLLQGTVFQTIPARTLTEARHLLRTLQPRAIILDVVLGGEESWDFLTEVKGEPSTRHVPVLVVTHIDDMAKALALGADGYARKPIERRWLIDQLSSLGDVAGVKRALIIDDDEVVRYLMKGLLRDTSWAMSEASDGASGLELARSLRPGVIFCDLHMPGMSGLEVIDRLEADPSTRDIPIVVATVRRLTSDEQEDLRRRGITLMSKEALGHHDGAAEMRRALVECGAES
jgi:CheY-like chemotaxis protein